MKKTFLGIATLFAFTLLCASCDDDVNALSTEYFDLLQGTWETTHIVEDDWWAEYDVSGPVPPMEHYYKDCDITRGGEDYEVVCFDKNRRCTILEGSDYETLPITCTFSLDGNKLYGWFFMGDYAKYVTITKISSNKIVMELVDDGKTIENGRCQVQKYNSKTTMEKIEYPR